MPRTVLEISADRPSRFGPATSLAGRVLVVDDDPQMRALLTSLVQTAGHSCEVAASAEEARSALDAETHDLVLLDVYLPDESGLSLARDVRRRASAPAVVMVSGEDDPGLVRIALDAGAYGYVTKPFRSSDLEIAIDNALRRLRVERESGARRVQLEDAVVDRTAAAQDALERMRLAQEDTILRLSKAVDLRIPYTGSHIERMSQICAIVGRHFGLDVELLRNASRLHDIGKIAVPDAILRKPGPLTPEERIEMERHAEIGHRVLCGSASTLLDTAAEIAWTHHERFDGTGYPRGLAGEQIPLTGRIAAVADVFDALTNDRPYRRAFSLDEALSMLKTEAGRHFDTVVVDAFFQVLDEVTEVMAQFPRSDDELAGVLTEAPTGPRLLTLQQAATTLGVSASTMRRWADDGRIPAARTSGGHRRFAVEAVRRLAAERGPQARVRPLRPPCEPLPWLAERVRVAGGDLRAKTTASLYHGGPDGWFGHDDATASIDAWMDQIVRAGETGGFDAALEGTTVLMQWADMHGTTALERHGFLERFGEAVIRAMGTQASRAELIGARRLFVSMRHTLLADAD